MSRHEGRFRPSHQNRVYGEAPLTTSSPTGPTYGPAAYAPPPVQPGYTEPVVESGAADQQISAVDGVVLVPETVQTEALADGAVTTPKIATNAITEALLATDIKAIKIYAGEPTLPDADYPADTIIYDSTAQVFKKTEDGTTWTSLVNATDLTGQITTTQITDSAITTDKILANAVTTAKIAALAIEADQIAANAVTAAKLSAVIVLASLIKTANSGSRVEFDSNGIRLYDSTGILVVYLPTDGSEVWVRGTLEASGLTVTGDATFRGEGNLLEGGAVLTVGDGIAAPTVAPTVSATWGLMTHYELPATVQWGAEYNPTGGSDGATPVVYLIPTVVEKLYEVNAGTGELIREITLHASTLTTVFGVALLSNYIYVLSGSGSAFRVDRYSETTGAHDTAYTSITMPTSHSAGTLASDGTYLYIAQYHAASVTKFQKYDSSMATVGSVVSATISEISDPFDIKVGAFDFGGDRMVIVQAGGGNTSAHVIDLSGVHKTDECFPISATTLSIYWDGSQFFSYDSGGGSVVYFNVHSDWTWGSGTSSKVWVGYTWYDSAGTTHETNLSPKRSVTMGKRKYLEVVTPVEPGSGGADEPNQRRIYVAHGSTEPTDANMDLQVGTDAESYSLTGYDSGGAAPPASNDFDSAGTAEVSSAVAGWALYGDGTADLGLVGGGGTSFPAVKATGDRYFRTDLGMEFYYDGTRWLSTQLFTSTSNVETSSGSFYIVLSATQASAMRCPLPVMPGSDIYIDKVSMVGYVSSGGSALSGSHKWTATFNKIDATNTATSLGTAALDSGNSQNWRYMTLTVGAVLGGTYTHLRLDMAKAGTPGDLNITGGLTATYRVVAT